MYDEILVVFNVVPDVNYKNSYNHFYLLVLESTDKFKYNSFALKARIFQVHVPTCDGLQLEFKIAILVLAPNSKRRTGTCHCTST